MRISVCILAECYATEVLTSNDLNWQTESLKEISSNMSHDEFLKSIHDQYSEGHGPNINNE